MNKLVTLRDFLKEYNISKEEFIQITNKDKAFFDKYIEWEKSDDATIISPKALERLGKELDNNKSENIPLNVHSSSVNKESKTTLITPGNVQFSKSVNNNEITTRTKTRRKKSKLNITKQFIQDNGNCDFLETHNTKELRQFLINASLYKIEQVALMSDSDVLNAVTKEYFFINTSELTYIIKKTVLTNNISDIFVLPK